MHQNAHQGKASDSPTVAVSEFFDGCPLATFAIDKDCVITHWNKACERLTGCPASEMIGTRKHSLAFFHRELPMLSDLIVTAATTELEKFIASTVIPSSDTTCARRTRR